MQPLTRKRREQSSLAVAELIEQVSRSLVGRAYVNQMNPAQWTALRYLAHANPSAREIGAFARFHNTSPSSASQTFGALVSKGMVSKAVGTDARRRTLELTSKGRDALHQDPIVQLAGAIETLPDDKLLLLADAMHLLMRAVAANR